MRLRITCDLQYQYLIYKVASAVQRFMPDNVVSLVPRRNCVDVSCYSNDWEKILGWRADGGSKLTQNVDVPTWIKVDQKLSVCCLRGLIETDGSIYYDRGYPMLMFVTAIAGLANSVYGMIQSLGYTAHVYMIQSKSKGTLHHVRLSKDVNSFLRLVNPEKF